MGKPRPTGIDKAISQLEGEKAVLDLAIRKLREQQATKALGKAAKKAAGPISPASLPSGGAGAP